MNEESRLKTKTFVPIIPDSDNNIIASVSVTNYLRRNNGTLNEETYKAGWDTGSFRSMVSPRVVNDLGLKKINVDGGIISLTGKKQFPICFAAIKLCNTDIVFDNLTLFADVELIGFDVLIGMDIISQGKFTLSPTNGGLDFIFDMS